MPFIITLYNVLGAPHAGTTHNSLTHTAESSVAYTPRFRPYTAPENPNQTDPGAASVLCACGHPTLAIFAHAMALGMGPWLAVEIPSLIAKGMIKHSDDQ